MSEVLGYLHHVEDENVIRGYIDFDDNGYCIVNGINPEVAEWHSKSMWKELDQLNKSETYTQVGNRIGELVDKKNKQYGDSFNKSGEFLSILYPNGIQPDQYKDALALVRIFDKQMRIANGNQGDEDAYQDIVGYGLLMSGE